MKIVDADKLHYKQVYIQSEKGLRPALVVFAKEIRKMPEIVRCKDCKWYGRKYPWNDHYMECSYLEAPMDDNDYCSWGERREDERT